MSYVILSFTHKNSDLPVREKLAFDNAAKQQAVLESVHANKFIDEAMVLSTCNRVEFLLFVRDSSKALEFLLEYLAEFSGLPLENLRTRADIYTDSSAVHHFFCVCSSLDSLVVGETQIAGQIKNAFKFAYDAGFCNQHLSRLVHYAFRCAGAVRNCTEISKNPVSVASVAILKLKEIMGDLNDVPVVIIGLGEMSRLCIKHLQESGAKIILFNRDFGKAQLFANELAKPIELGAWENLASALNTYAIALSATAAPSAIITKQLLKPCDFERFWFDLAVPRDIDIGDAKGISVVSVDDLQDIVAKNLTLREEQARKAYGIVGRFTQEFFVWLQSLSVEPIIKALREQARDAAIAEINKAIKKGYLPKEYENNIHKSVQNIFNKFLHAPTISLKGIAHDPQADVLVDALRFLFGIQTEHSVADPSSRLDQIDTYRCEYDSTLQTH